MSITISGVSSGFANLNNTNITTSTLIGTAINVTNGSIIAAFNSNTIGNLCTTGGNIGINNVSPGFSIDINSGLADATSFTGQNMYVSGDMKAGTMAMASISGGTLSISGNIECKNSMTCGSIRTVNAYSTTYIQGASNVSTLLSSINHNHDTVYLSLNGNQRVTGSITAGTTMTVANLRIISSSSLISNAVYSFSGVSYFTGSSSVSITPFAWLNSANTGATSNGETNTYSISSSDRIVASEFNAYSDIRIKKNIIDINDESALDTIRIIEPKIYKYIDWVKRGNTPVYGFIAQQVEAVLPYSVKALIEYIPNIYDTAEVQSHSSGSLLILDNVSTNNFTNSNVNDNQLKVRLLFNDSGSRKKEVIVKQIIDNNKILIDTLDEELENNIVFVYGQEINDFKFLNKSSIFTVSVAALQEVDRQLQAAKILIQEQNNKIEMQKSKIDNQRIQIQSNTVTINDFKNRLQMVNL